MPDNEKDRKKTISSAEIQPPQTLADPIPATSDNTVFIRTPGTNDGSIDVSLTHSGVPPTGDQSLWALIRNRTDAISFNRYKAFMDDVMCCTQEIPLKAGLTRKENMFPGALPFPGVESYAVLKFATEAFLMHESGVLSLDGTVADFTGFDTAFGKLDDSEARRFGRPVTTQDIFDDLRAYLEPALAGRPAQPRLFTKLEAALNRDVTTISDDEAKRILLDLCNSFKNSGDLPAKLQNAFGDGECTEKRFSTNFRPTLESLRQSYQNSLKLEATPLVLPYFNRILSKLSELPLKGPNEVPANCYGILRSKVTGPCLLELIWSYWHEEGMLVQTLNTISLRFQNRRLHPDRDPLARLDVDPLRPLSNLLWSHIQDEQHRLSLVRRAYEYDHHYGLSISGKAVPKLQSADSRSKFLEGFHNLLQLTSVFYKEDADTTVIADGFPMLNALREVHLLLAEGAHNQFGDLPSNARQEMLIQMWLLARPEMREFLGGRIMVPYTEPWMDRVDTMKTMQGWTDVSATHFRDLGVHGEQILLSIRYGNWSQINDRDQAANWARYWRPEIQRYIHAYRAATGVDLTKQYSDKVDSTAPSVHLRNRLIEQGRRS
jgi:hypothetical protein